MCFGDESSGFRYLSKFQQSFCLLQGKTLVEVFTVALFFVTQLRTLSEKVFLPRNKIWKGLFCNVDETSKIPNSCTFLNDRRLRAHALCKNLDLRISYMQIFTSMLGGWTVMVDCLQCVIHYV